MKNLPGVFTPRRLRALVVVALLSLGFAASAQTREWTVLVYLMADNNLESAAMADLVEMSKAKFGASAALVAQITASGDNNETPVPGLGLITSTLRLEAGNGGLKKLADLGDTNSADPKTLSTFVSWGLKTYPAKHYALVLWDHGGAWPGYGEDARHDEGSFDLATLKGAIGEGLKGGALAQFDLIGFDACLMATYEVARTLRPQAKYLLASEELEPGHGWDYARLSVLADKPDTETVGKALLAGFVDSSVQEGDRDEITLALLNLQKLDAVDKAVDAFAAYGRPKLADIATQLGRVQAKTQGYGKSSDPAAATNMIDLGQFVRLYAAADPAAAKVRKQLDDALASVVVQQVSGKLTAGSTGLSVYFPNQKRYYSDGYAAVDAGSWKTLLNDYYSVGTKLAPAKAAGAAPAADGLAFTNPDNTGDLTVDADGVVMLTGKLPPKAAAKVVDGLFSYGLVQGEELVFLGDTEVGVDDKTGEVWGTWDLQVLRMIQGKNTAYCYSSETSADDGGFEYTVPLRYYAGGKVAGDGDEISLVLTTDDQYNVTNQEYFSESNGKWGAFHPKKGSVIVPTWEKATGDGESVVEATTKLAFDPNKPLTYDYEPLDIEKNDIYLELEVYDVGDNSDYVNYEGPAASEAKSPNR